MATQTSLIAQQVRIRQWAVQIRACQNRPAGMDVDTWCVQNNLTKSNYYYRLRRVRKACLDQIPAAESPAFIELPAPVSKEHDLCRQTLASPVTGMEPVVHIQNTKGLSAEIFPGASPEIIRQLVEIFHHAE